MPEFSGVWMRCCCLDEINKIILMEGIVVKFGIIMSATFVFTMSVCLRCAASISEWKYNPETGSYYAITAEATTWVAAESYAQSIGAHLVTINSEDENQWLVDTFGPTLTGQHAEDQLFWGGFRVSGGVWSWSYGDGGWWAANDGSSTSFVNWAPGQPDNNSETCIEIYLGSTYYPSWASGAWNNQNPQGARRAIIEAEIILPNIVQVERNPDSGMHLVQPSSSQLKLYDSDIGQFLTGGSVDTTKPTVILTHGWTLFNTAITAEEYFGQIDDLLGNATEANIFAWDWNAASVPTGSGQVGISSRHYQTAAANTWQQGQALGDAVVLTLTNNCTQEYNQTIHFVGHSLGARVNAAAANVIHSNGFNWINTHVTVLDAPEVFNLDQYMWESSIPNQAAWIDNYISLVGDLHPEAVNVILREGMPISFVPGPGSILDAVEFHSYPISWYAETIGRPLDSFMGFRWAFEGTGLNGSPGRGQYYAQTVSVGDDQLIVEPISELNAKTILLGRGVLAVGQLGLLAIDPSKSIIGRGKVVVEAVKKTRTFIGKTEQVYHALRVILEEASPAYAWLPTQIPEDAQWVSLEFQCDNMGDEDVLTIGIDSVQLFVMKGSDITDGEFYNTGPLDISDFSGQDIEFFIGLDSDNIAGAKVVFEGVTYHTFVTDPYLYALPGDANGDDRVNLDDFIVLKQHYGQSGMSWIHGDFNGDGVVNVDDFIILKQNYGLCSLTE